ncbi:tRNA (adenosine(37)-N6)-threonylcarbamoyltransferase complex transferase subunit TsaD [Sediminibacterium sp.]|uniref:tRNA (adenosine(37)-N6)-threonylcarbamoyltransferase complex transferase subunit TsaD n=1 Tax=Sediminibacterium sp. TaxID=1917865 RepID=UPI00272FC580|nr:tRNA (adenosine(37)-N6)-threonylcarbamoyltransferase complex transferase subunit TsaD [Sediminibacterium sp.]MDP1973960.1 tRNA (adenosine(37)-N6)-threonylcarbamoyltransferase complex transferase subunit TsaD [Sediminibacterium sp.]MDP2421247.1 tRNA (adenosine(37)-N6)-threonylcarbamoyltransferase complex transferase subunit TsaD [Sediminibacterium sp.]
MSVTILAIESSCDETAAAVCRDGAILSNIIASQSVHEKYGGVVPELASRAHMQNIVPVVEEAINTAGISLPDLNAIAFTQAPGLIGSLLVGTQFAKSLSLSLGVPLIGVHHMQAHVLANLISENRPDFPFLCLTVSGGHTQIVLAKSALALEVIGETIDDAAGEAFDKTAKLLGLPYPGGPLIDQYAQLGDPLKFKFAEPQIPELNFSFSGLKTSVLYFLQKQTPEFILENRNDLCASIQYTIVQILLKKLVKAVNQTNVKQVCIAGGVSANSGLRNALTLMGEKKGWKVYIPDFSYCTDNAAMIAITGYHKYLNNQFVPLSVNPSARAEW